VTVMRRDGTPAESHGDRRGYSRGSAAPGNTLAARSGARSERLVSEHAEEVLEELVELYPWLTTADGVALDVLVRAKARHDLLAAYIEDIVEGRRRSYPRKGFPDTGIEAVPERVWQQISREARTVLDTASRLGLTAVDRAQLAKDLGLARHYGNERVIADLIAKGQAVLDRR